ncbi:SGNH/GDSL hydrolase family protein [Propionibacteriaceae bacterium Y1700]|uniref:SGNH/GDSL hydrolase family protein n=1 Tax=Microlunatus sp. Y1700 TaxID=3418487 RepID=UPI003DA726D1
MSSPGGGSPEVGRGIGGAAVAGVAAAGEDEQVAVDHDVNQTVTRARADDPALRWEGTIETEHTPEWSRGWRLPLSRIDLFPSRDLQSRAAMQAGVRVVFETDTTSVRGRLALPSPVGAAPDAGVKSTPELPVDLVVDHEVISAPIVEGRFSVTGLRAGTKVVQIWLPQYGDVRLVELELDAGAVVCQAPTDRRPRLTVYGSSISHCVEASTPTRTWPALVSRELDLDLTCLGFSGQCHLDPMIGRVIAQHPAELVITCLGINVWGSGVFNRRSFLPAVLGLLSTIRDGHPDTPILVMSPISCPDRDNAEGASGMTLREIGDFVVEATELLRKHGDADLHLLEGPTVLGPDDADRLHDGLHPDTEGYALMASRIAPVVRKLLPAG